MANYRASTNINNSNKTTPDKTDKKQQESKEKGIS
jgi:hypothetical protein